jgi:hypothetical protein
MLVLGVLCGLLALSCLAFMLSWKTTDRMSVLVWLLACTYVFCTCGTYRFLPEAVLESQLALSGVMMAFSAIVYLCEEIDAWLSRRRKARMELEMRILEIRVQRGL